MLSSKTRSTKKKNKITPNILPLTYDSPPIIKYLFNINEIIYKTTKDTNYLKSTT